MDAGGGGGIGEDENTQWDPEEATTSRGNSTRQSVDLGQSNRSSGDILVNIPGCLQRQDENPCMKTVWEMDTGGGGGIGEGEGVDGRSETVISSQDQQYETDEEEFCQDAPTLIPATGLVREPPKISWNTAKRDVSARAKKGDYNLSYFNLWWSRMAVESRREAKEASRRNVMEERMTGSTRKSKTRREPKVASDLSESNRGNYSNSWMGLSPGGGDNSKLQYLDEAKLGENSRNIRKSKNKMVLADTTDGGGGLCGKGK
jgi:hypothetical protein